MKLKYTQWNGTASTRYWIDQLDAESFGGKAAYQICQIDRSTNLQRQFTNLDPRWGRDDWKSEGDQQEIHECLKSAPANIKRILRRFVVK